MSEQQESFVSHLVELRDRLVRALIAVGVVFAGLCLYPGPGAIYDLMALPLTETLPAGMHIQDWLLSELDALDKALGSQ